MAIRQEVFDKWWAASRTEAARDRSPAGDPNARLRPADADADLDRRRAGPVGRWGHRRDRPYDEW